MSQNSERQSMRQQALFSGYRCFQRPFIGLLGPGESHWELAKGLMFNLFHDHEDVFVREPAFQAS